MSKHIIKLIVNISYIITAFYAVFNLAAVILHNVCDFDKVGWFVEFALSIDVLTWFFYGVFTMMGFVFLLVTRQEDSKTTKGVFIFRCISHLAMMIISFACIMTIFADSF